MTNCGQFERRSADPIRVLLIEDDPHQAVLIAHTLHQASRRFTVTWTKTLAEALDRLAEPHYDVTVVDLGLSDSQGLATFDRVFAAAPHIPTVVMTSNDN